MVKSRSRNGLNYTVTGILPTSGSEDNVYFVIPPVGSNYYRGYVWKGDQYDLVTHFNLEETEEVNVESLDLIRRKFAAMKYLYGKNFENIKPAVHVFERIKD